MAKIWQKWQNRRKKAFLYKKVIMQIAQLLIESYPEYSFDTDMHSKSYDDIESAIRKEWQK